MEISYEKCNKKREKKEMESLRQKIYNLRKKLKRRDKKVETLTSVLNKLKEKNLLMINSMKY